MTSAVPCRLGYVDHGGCGTASDAAAFILDVREIQRPDLATLDGLAWLGLLAQRSGRRLLLLHASVELRELLAFAGLDAVIACAPPTPGSGLDPIGQAEHREEARRVEEEGDARDPSR